MNNGTPMISLQVFGTTQGTHHPGELSTDSPRLLSPVGLTGVRGRAIVSGWEVPMCIAFASAASPFTGCHLKKILEGSESIS